MLDIKGNFEFPEEIKDIVGGIKNPTQWRIIEVLLSNDNILHYEKLCSKLGISKEDKDFFNQLTELQKNRWLYNETVKHAALDDVYNSSYGITEFGLIIIKGIMTSFENALIRAKSAREHKEMQLQHNVKIIISNNIISRQFSFKMDQNPSSQAIKTRYINQRQLGTNRRTKLGNDPCQQISEMKRQRIWY